MTAPESVCPWCAKPGGSEPHEVNRQVADWHPECWVEREEFRADLMPDEDDEAPAQPKPRRG